MPSGLLISFCRSIYPTWFESGTFCISDNENKIYYNCSLPFRVSSTRSVPGLLSITLFAIFVLFWPMNKATRTWSRVQHVFSRILVFRVPKRGQTYVISCPTFFGNFLSVWGQKLRANRYDLVFIAFLAVIFLVSTKYEAKQKQKNRNPVTPSTHLSRASDLVFFRTKSKKKRCYLFGNNLQNVLADAPCIKREHASK